MAQSDHQLLIQSKPYLYASVLSGCLAFLTLLSGQVFLAIGITILCTLLVINLFKSRDTKYIEQSFKWFKHSSLALAIVAAIGIIEGIDSFKTWLYFVPLLIFFFYEFKPALWLVGTFSAICLIALNYTGNIFENIQTSLSYLLYLSMSCSLVYLRELRRKQLKPLRRTDNLTKAATREHLDNDLTKEIQRSEREGSELSTVALAIDDICLSKLSPKEKDTVTINIGKLLHNNLRLFDSYYLWEHHEFLIVLPHTSSVQAVKIANALRIQVRKEIEVQGENITISAGVSGLNIGDNSGSLTHRATQALKQTQKTSNNRILLYREESEGEELQNGVELDNTLPDLQEGA
jgi:diguanylate cyclase (GGDEF)-like protein